VIVIAGRPQEAMHAGCDGRQPPCGAFLCVMMHILMINRQLVRYHPVAMVCCSLLQVLPFNIDDFY